MNVYHFTGGPCAEVVAIGAAATQGVTELETIVAVGDRGRGVDPAVRPVPAGAARLLPAIRVIVGPMDALRVVQVADCCRRRTSGPTSSRGAPCRRTGMRRCRRARLTARPGDVSRPAAASSIDRGTGTLSNRTMPSGTIQLITCTTSRPARTAGSLAIELAGLLRGDGEHDEPAQPLVVGVEERPGGEDEPLLHQPRLVGQVGVLQPVGRVQRQLGRVRRPEQEHDGVLVESHAHTLGRPGPPSARIRRRPPCSAPLGSTTAS